LARRPPPRGSRPPGTGLTAGSEEIRAIAAPSLTRLLLLVSGGTAIASFIYEVAWIALLSLVLGSATHSFELMLSAFILGRPGVALDSPPAGLVHPLRFLALVQVVMGVLAIRPGRLRAVALGPRWT
jgi:hypothetical protein